MTDEQNPQNSQGHPNPEGGAQNNPPNQGDTEKSGHISESNFEEVVRRYSGSISPADRAKAFAIEDERYETGKQVRDWLKLLLMIVITDVWCLIVYFLTPGLK
jgi:hypothetical protein